jgi:hypothetical protein
MVKKQQKDLKMDKKMDCFLALTFRFFPMVLIGRGDQNLSGYFKKN